MLALLFTVASFWWLNARRGRLKVAQPHAYAFASKARLRLPPAVYNTGASSLIVANLRLRIEDDPTRSELEWITTRTKLRPEHDGGFAFATPFAVGGRSTREVIAEFGHDDGWSPEPESHRRLHLDAIIHPAAEWRELASFDWWAPPAEAPVAAQYLTYRNAPPGAAVDLDQDEGGGGGGGEAEPESPSSS